MILHANLVALAEIFPIGDFAARLRELLIHDYFIAHCVAIIVQRPIQNVFPTQELTVCTVLANLREQVQNPNRDSAMSAR